MYILKQHSLAHILGNKPYVDTVCPLNLSCLRLYPYCLLPKKLRANDSRGCLRTLLSLARNFSYDNRLFVFLSSISLEVASVTGIDDGVCPRSRLPVRLTFQIKFNSVGRQDLFLGVVAPFAALPCTFSYGMVG